MFDSNKSSRSITNAVIETLEERRLLSADLAPIFGNQVPANFKPGNSNHVVVDVLNMGDAKAVGPVTVDLFASPASGGDDMLLGTMTKRLNVKAGRQGALNIRFAEPTGLADGNYDLVAQINANGMTNTVATNDIVTSSSPTTLKNPFTDVAAKSVKAPTQAIVIDGNFVRQEPAAVTIVNRGTAKSSGEVSINFYLSTDAFLDRQDVLVGTIQPSPANLRPGGSETLKGLIGAEGLKAGLYNLFAVVTPVGGNVQNTAGDRIGLAGKQVQVIVIAPPPVINPITPTTTGTQSDTSTAGQTCTTTNPTCTTTNPTCTTAGPTCDTTSPSCNTSSQSCDTSDQSGDTTGQTCDTGNQSTDDAGQQDDSSGQTDDSNQPSSDDNTQQQDDQSQTQPADSGQDTSDPSQAPTTTDSGTDTSTDGSGDTSTDDSSGDTSSDVSSGDTSGDDSSADTSSDDSSADTSSDDSSGDSSGDDGSEGDFIARRSATSTSPKTTSKVTHNKVAHHAPVKHVVVAKAPKAPARVVSRK